MNDSAIYKDNFYENRDKMTAFSAKRILKIIADACPELRQMKSAVDIGCGVGTWLKQFRELYGSDKIIGYDGDYVKQELLVIPKEDFISYNLEQEIPREQRYDLAISMEVAEHLSESRADSFVDDLCALSDHVLFSAASVFQGGTGHINEQRLHYWVNKFAERRYEPLDIIRSKIWDEDEILPWYKQNTILFKKSSKPQTEFATVRDLIHPDIFEMKMRKVEQYRQKLYFRFYFMVRNIYRRVFGK